jgi:hypothetical protein
MTFAPHQDDLAFALAQQRVDAELTAQTLRDCLHIGMGVGRALETQAVVLTTERTFSGQLPRGADLTASLDRFSRAMRRTVVLLGKINEDIVALYRAAPEGPPEPLTRPEPTRSNLPTTERADTETPDTDPAERAHFDDTHFDDTRFDDTRYDDTDDEDPAETIPGGPIAELIEDIKRDLTLTDPRLADPTLAEPTLAETRLPGSRDAEQDSTDGSGPSPQTGRWSYRRAEPEPAIPGVLTLDDLQRLSTGPSG